MVIGVANPRRLVAILGGLAVALGAGCVDVDLPPRPVAVESPDGSGGGPERDASPGTDGDLPKDAAVALPPIDAAGPPDVTVATPDAAVPVDGAVPADLPALKPDAALPPDAALAKDTQRPLPDASLPIDRAPSTGGGHAGLIVGDANVLIPADTLTRARLQARGLTVTVIDGAAASPSDAVDRDLIVISTSIATRAAAFDRVMAFRGSAVPILCLAVHTCDQLGMTVSLGTQSGEVEDDDSINVTAPGHPLADGLPAGLVPVMNPKAGEHWVLYWMNPHTTAIRVASMRNAPSKVAIFGFEKGAALSNEQLAPARRVVFTLMPNTTNGNYQLNATGIALLDAAIAWAVQ
jgi:hypothetical protein